MTLKEHVEAVVGLMQSKPTFIYGSTNDLNARADTVRKMPIVFMLDTRKTELKLHASGGLSESQATYFEFFSPVELAEGSDKVDAVQSQMLTEIKDFIVKAKEYRVNGSKVFKFDTGDTAQSINFVDKYDINVAGRTLDIVLKPMYIDSFC